MQLVELQEARERFTRMGLGLAAVTYDNEATLKEFAAAQHIEYPLLADPTSRIIRAFGVLDPDNSEFNRAGDGSVPGDMAYPGYIVIDRSGIVTSKYFEDIYSDRHTPNNVLGQILPEIFEGSREPVRGSHLSARTGQSDLVAAPGNRVTLFVDIDLPRGIHVYAPGDHRYRPLELRLAPPPPFETRPVALPPSEVMEIPAIHERVPVYSGKIRVSQDVIVPGRQREFLISLRDAPDHAVTLEITGTLRYQACEAKVCYKPEEITLSWPLTVKGRRIPRTSEQNRRAG